MSPYECVLIARNDVTEQQVEGIADGIANRLQAEGGAMKKREYWDLRPLAYRIKGNRKGHSMPLGLDAKPVFVNEIERQLRLNEDILRFLTLSVDDIKDEQPRSCPARPLSLTATFADLSPPQDSTAVAGAVSVTGPARFR